MQCVSLCVLAKKCASCVLAATYKLLQCCAIELSNETSTKTRCANEKENRCEEVPRYILTLHGILPGTLYSTKFHLTISLAVH